MTSTPHDWPPFGYAIQYGNNPEVPCWLVMRWCDILFMCDTLEEAAAWLMGELEEEAE